MAKIDEPTPGRFAPRSRIEAAAALGGAGGSAGAGVRLDLRVPPDVRSQGSAEATRASCRWSPGCCWSSIIFQSQNAHFLTAANLVNLLVQAALISMLAMGEVYALLLGEIDLSIGFVAGLGGIVLVEALKPSGLNWPWWAAIAAALGVCALIGLLQGTLITRIGLPSFIVTLAGLLFWQGVMLRILGNGGSILVGDNDRERHHQRQPDAARELDRDARDRRGVRGHDVATRCAPARAPAWWRRRPA